MRIIIDDLLMVKGKTRYWLAKETGVTYQSVVNLCNNGTTSINFEFLRSICVALDCTPNDIFHIKRD